jgi:divalent metal cation (Fe/Co/Zn/Cd) transporter
MKSIFLSLCLFLSTITLAQPGTTKAIEPDQETSYENMELLVIALVGLFILLLVYFFFRRNRRKS